MNRNQKFDLLSEKSCDLKENTRLDYCLNQHCENRLEKIVSHMYQQYQEYVSSTINTSKIFEEMLNEINNVIDYIRHSINLRGLEESQVFCEIDADRSVAILNVLWHSISFTTRGNTKPMALYRENKDPLFAGRIIAFNGDFQDIALELQNQEYPDMLNSEIASMFIPHDDRMPAIMKLSHLPDKDLYFDQKEAPKQFLLKVIEIICGGGIYHETDMEAEYD